MKRALLIVSGLGLLCVIIEIVYLALPSQSLSDQQTIDMVAFVSLMALPVIGVIGAILGAIAAGQQRASRWMVAFILLAIITLPLYGFGFLASIVGSFPGNQAMTIFVTALLYFPSVIFPAALVFALRHPARADALPATVSHVIDSGPQRE